QTNIHAESVVAIDEDRRCPDFADCAYGSDERIRGRDDFIADADAQHFQRKLERIRSGVDADGVARADKIGEAAFELAQRLAEGEVARRHESLELAPQVLTIAELLGQVRVAHAHTVRASVP